jgi:hypothetical protein
MIDMNVDVRLPSNAWSLQKLDVRKRVRKRQNTMGSHLSTGLKWNRTGEPLTHI